MKNKSRAKGNQGRRSAGSWPRHCLAGTALLMGFGAARAAEQDNSVFEGGTNTFANWVEVSAGGIFTSGSKAQAEQARRANAGAFGGIEDFHYQTEAATNTTFTVDGRALFDRNDYRLQLGLVKPEQWFLRLKYEEFRTWSDANGGFFQPEGIWYPLAESALGLDRGSLMFEAGMTPKGKPSVTFRYTHQFRAGEKSSTIWGQTHPDFTSLTRGLGPSFYSLDESRDIFELDLAYRYKLTDLGLGVRYEISGSDNTRYTTQWPGEPAVQRRISDQQDVSYDSYSVHFTTETWLKKNLLFSSGFMISEVDSDFKGSRIYGEDFDVSYAPNALNGAGYYNLAGTGDQHEYVLNLNLMSIPRKNLTIVPSIRVQKEDWGANGGTFQTLGDNPPGFLASNTDGDALDVRERLDVRYTGVTNCVLYAQGEWTQGEGNLQESGGTYLGGPIQRETEDGRFFQKYTVGCRVYPARRWNFDLGGYFKNNAYDYDHQVDSTANAPIGNRYPAFLVMQNFETYDGFARVTVRPLPNLTLVSRYEYQVSSVHTTPDAASTLADVDSSEMTSHIFAQNISWSPWSRLYLQAGFNYVVSEIGTPVSGATSSALDAQSGANYTRAILNAQNNYWTLNFNSGLVLDAKTDLNVGYTYYRADDYTDSKAAWGLPYSAGVEQHGISGMVVRRINEHLRLKLSYGFYHSDDEVSGGNNSYDAHVVYSSLQYRF